jgi:hypothetical protein
MIAVGRLLRIRLLALLDGGHKTVATLVEGLDHTLLASAVANGLSRQFDRTFKRGAGNKLPGPYLLIEFIPGYDTVSMLDEIDE